MTKQKASNVLSTVYIYIVIVTFNCQQKYGIGSLRHWLSTIMGHMPIVPKLLTYMNIIYTYIDLDICIHTHMCIYIYTHTYVYHIHMPCTTLNPWRSPFAVRAVSPKSISFPSPGDADEDGSRGGQGQGHARSDAPGGRGRGEALQSRHRGRWEQWS